MTTPRYPNGCTAESQARGDAWSPDYAWIVNFNNGNANDYHRDNNNACVRAVRSVASGEYQGADGGEVSLRQLHDAWRIARRGKMPSKNQLAFDSRWADGLLQLQRELNAGTWRPRPTTCFIATRPKAREIHAPAFADRVVHHWLVPQIEAIYEQRFIHDSYANRKGKGKGSHAAVRRLQSFVRQVHSGRGSGFYLQLDIHNFFNSIHRPTLWRMLKERMQKHGLPSTVLRTAHALLRHSVERQGVVYRSSHAERALVPHHKRLANAPDGFGLPIGNLSSQFFANVYLDALDQFVKHTLKAKRYLRYVDDFVLVHESRDQLAVWLSQIEAFLRDTLRLRLKPDTRLRSLGDGVDFLGYIVHPTHTRVRRRVVAHARAALAGWERDHVKGKTLQVTPADLRCVSSTWSSYQGHLRHANSHRLRANIERRFPWLGAATAKRQFHHSHEWRLLSIALHAQTQQVAK